MRVAGMKWAILAVAALSAVACQNTAETSSPAKAPVAGGNTEQCDPKDPYSRACADALRRGMGLDQLNAH
ncbi:hypothetical protein [Zavarzinia aquatilis]|uniref:hypothetical protein n=1 Tax=Zavarzinia aquatilis TaxID=2211142 RepID=UPI0010576491|nr:hypothetical protein [Zavarzinia aquatilis]